MKKTFIIIASLFCASVASAQPQNKDAAPTPPTKPACLQPTTAHPQMRTGGNWHAPMSAPGNPGWHAPMAAPVPGCND